MAQVKVLKFTNGHEIIAKIVDETSTHIVVDAPLALQPVRMPNSPEGITLSLLPFSWGGLPQDVSLSRSHILCELTPEPQLETQYLAGLAGLSLPDSSTPSKAKLTLVE